MGRARRIGRNRETSNAGPNPPEFELQQNVIRSIGSSVIFSDRVETDYLAFGSGAIAEIHDAEDRAILVPG